MVTYEEAYAKAHELKDPIDRCVERENAFIFGHTEDDHYRGGAGHTPVVILKDDGRAVNMPYFVMHKPGKELRRFRVDENGNPI